jgi:cytochrome b6-f complex iron-sulfur subunit
MSGSLDRRTFLKVSGSAVAVVALARCGGNNTPAVGVFAGGNVADYTVGMVALFNDGPFFVGRDAGGMYAMSAVCTHQGCTVGEGTTSLTCPCHGARYDLVGTVTNGPATQDLEHYQLDIDANDDITVDTGAPVNASTRVAV